VRFGHRSILRSTASVDREGRAPNARLDPESVAPLPTQCDALASTWRLRGLDTVAVDA
jgi:hypothetical protein